MKRLFTPWRLKFVRNNPRGDDGQCVFCDISQSNTDKDEHNLVLYRAKYSYVLLNKFPYTCGHMMVIPYNHSGDYTSLDKNSLEEIYTLSQTCVQILQKQRNPKGFNIGLNIGKSGGAGIPQHLHLHVVPRWEGDSNFMPIIGETKVLPESLEQTYAALKPLFSNM